jgi:hypothetical protein
MKPLRPLYTDLQSSWDKYQKHHHKDSRPFTKDSEDFVSFEKLTGFEQE